MNTNKSIFFFLIFSFYNWETQTSTSNPTPNYQVIAENASGLLFKNKRDRKILNVDPKVSTAGVKQKFCYHVLLITPLSLFLLTALVVGPIQFLPLIQASHFPLQFFSFLLPSVHLSFPFTFSPFHIGVIKQYWLKDKKTNGCK